MKKMNLWLKLLSLLLVCGMILGCCVGCGENQKKDGDDDEKPGNSANKNDGDDDEKPGNSVNKNDGEDDEKPGNSANKNDGDDNSGNNYDEEKAEQQRQDLVTYQWNGLKFYLDENFEQLVNNSYMAIYTYNDEGLRVTVDGSWADGSVSSAEELRESYLNTNNQNNTATPDIMVTSPEEQDARMTESAEAENEEENETGVANGTPYVVQSTGKIVGFYYQDGYGWTIEVIYESDSQKDDAIKYATLGEVFKVPQSQNQNQNDAVATYPATKGDSDYENWEEDGDYMEPTEAEDWY